MLVLSWVFPNHRQPVHGPFVLARMKALSAHADLRVIAPIPWFPFGRLVSPSTRPSVVARETIDGIETYHPRFFQPPGGPSRIDAHTYYLAVRGLARRLRRVWPFDLIDAHFVYPDGRAATLLGRELGVPVTITLRGMLRAADRHPASGAMVEALLAADAVLSVSQELEDRAVRMRVPAEKITVAGNGVDGIRFAPVPRTEARARLGIDSERPVLISVGHLSRRKGFHRVIRLLPELVKRVPGLLYVIVGGDLYHDAYGSGLDDLARELGVSEHLLRVGAQLNEEVPLWLSAADVFCLLTSGEGWANVFLEAMACGLPVVTTRKGGNAEVVTSDEVGYVVPFGDEAAALDRLVAAFDRSWDRDRIRAYALEHTWERTAERVMEVWTGVLNRTNRLA